MQRMKDGHVMGTQLRMSFKLKTDNTLVCKIHRKTIIDMKNINTHTRIVCDTWSFNIL